MKALDFILDVITDPPAWLCWIVKWTIKIAIIGAIGAFIGLLIGKAMIEESRQIESGEISPHSGFCPDYPEWKGGENAYGELKNNY